jgi:hypothetical protein
MIAPSYFKSLGNLPSQSQKHLNRADDQLPRPIRASANQDLQFISNNNCTDGYKPNTRASTDAQNRSNFSQQSWLKGKRISTYGFGYYLFNGSVGSLTVSLYFKQLIIT